MSAENPGPKKLLKVKVLNYKDILRRKAESGCAVAKDALKELGSRSGFDYYIGS